MMDKLKKVFKKKEETPEEIKRSVSRAVADKDIQIIQLEARRRDLEKRVDKFAEMRDTEKLRAASKEVKKINQSIRLAKFERDKANSVIEMINKKNSTVETVEFMKKIRTWESGVSFDPTEINEVLGDLQYTDQGYKNVDDALNAVLGISEEDEYDEEVSDIMRRAMEKADVKREIEIREVDSMEKEFLLE